MCALSRSRRGTGFAGNDKRLCPLDLNIFCLSVARSTIKNDLLCQERGVVSPLGAGWRFRCKS